MHLTLTLLLFVLCSSVNAQVYAPVDVKSKVSFKIKNFGATVDGTFEGLKGTISFDAERVTHALFDVSIDAATIDTGIGMRDNHLRKSDYFNVTDFPVIRFVSGKVVQSAKAGEGIVTGKLTIKKTTKDISFPFRYSETGGVLKLAGTFTINRRDYSVGGNSISLADELTVLLDVTAHKQ